MGELQWVDKQPRNRSRLAGCSDIPACERVTAIFNHHRRDGPVLQQEDFPGKYDSEVDEDGVPETDGRNREPRHHSDSHYQCPMGFGLCCHP